MTLDASPRLAMQAPALPAIVIGGYLGSGKTTLVNRLLRAANGERLGVLVNDFGDVAIDAALIEARDGDVLSLAGGCVCCSFGADLVGALRTLAQRDPPVDRIVIETSGVALPRAVAQTARLAPAIAVEAIIVIADGETVRRRARDRYIGEMVLQQLREADLIVLNKLDLVAAAGESSDVEAVRTWLQQIAAGVPIVDATHADVAPALALEPPAAAAARVTDAALSPLRRRSMRISNGGNMPAAERFDCATLDCGSGVDVAALAGTLVEPIYGVLRAKGIVRDRSGAWHAIQTVGARACISQPPSASDPRAGRLVVIGLRGRLDVPALARAIGVAPG
ncbi:MAG TPA: CobW family GTP-binding protein [Burkholderiaceae bacterium]|nr:CobW family GTP-binding protein [Burkholderiaceae bacterium]